MEHLSDLTVFTRVALKKSFTLAGRELRMSTSAVSKHIARLELDLGAKLIHRSTQNATLTEAGALFYEHCFRILAAFDAARTDIVELGGEIKGLLRVHSTVGVGMNLVAPALIDFAEAHGTVNVELTIGELPTDLTTRQLDVIIASRHFGEDDPKVYRELSYDDLGGMPYVLCGSPVYFGRRGVPIIPQDLEVHDCLIHTTQKRNPDHWLFEQEDGQIRSIKVKEIFRSNVESAILLAATRGLGIARLPDYIAHSEINAGRLSTILDGLVHSKRLVRAFYPRTRIIPRKTRVFLDFMKKRFQSWTPPRTGFRDGQSA